MESVREGALESKLGKGALFWAVPWGEGVPGAGLRWGTSGGGAQGQPGLVVVKAEVVRGEGRGEPGTAGA